MALPTSSDESAQSSPVKTPKLLKTRKDSLSKKSSLGSIVEEPKKDYPENEVRERRRGSLASYFEKRRDSKVNFTVCAVSKR